VRNYVRSNWIGGQLAILSNGTGGIRRIELRERLHVLQRLVVDSGQSIQPEPSQADGRQRADAVSGGSLSRFSSRYLTSDMSKQPALLNSVIRTMSPGTEQEGRERLHLSPSFNAEASSSSACCRFRKRDMGVRDRITWDSETPSSLFQTTCIPREKRSNTQKSEDT
jgi:hypothetical protein